MTHDGLGKYLKEKITKARARPPTSSGSCRTPRRTCSSATCRSDRSRRPSGTSSRLCGRRRLRQLPAGLHRP
jgi:hypothetical protein